MQKKIQEFLLFAKSLVHLSSTPMFYCGIRTAEKWSQPPPRDLTKRRPQPLLPRTLLPFFCSRCLKFSSLPDKTFPATHASLDVRPSRTNKSPTPNTTAKKQSHHHRGNAQPSERSRQHHHLRPPGRREQLHQVAGDHEGRAPRVPREASHHHRHRHCRLVSSLRSHVCCYQQA